MYIVHMTLAFEQIIFAMSLVMNFLGVFYNYHVPQGRTSVGAADSSI